MKRSTVVSSEEFAHYMIAGERFTASSKLKQLERAGITMTAGGVRNKINFYVNNGYITRNDDFPRSFTATKQMIEKMRTHSVRTKKIKSDNQRGTIAERRFHKYGRAILSAEWALCLCSKF